MKFNFFLITFLFSRLLFAGQWSQMPDFPGTARDDAAQFSIGQKLYCVGGLQVGWSCTRNAYVLDAVNESWDSIADLPVATERQYACAFSYNGKGYLVGGINCFNTALKDFFCYDTVQQIWSTLPDFPGNGRYGASSFVLQNKAYLIGGKLSDGTCLNELWCYDFSLSQWSQLNPAPTAMWRGAAFSLDTCGFIAFGENSIGMNHQLYSYYPAQDSWQLISGIQLPGYAYVGTATGVDYACFFGGRDSLQNISNQLLVFSLMDSSISYHSGIPAFARKGGVAFCYDNTFIYSTGVSASFRTRETWKYSNFIGIQESASSTPTLEIFPNPNQGEFTLKAQRPMHTHYRLEVMNASGQILLSSEMHQPNCNFSFLPNGLYFLRIRDEHQVSMAKLLIH